MGRGAPGARGLPVILADLAGRNYASTTEVAQLWDGADPRTVRRMAEAGDIPSIRVGTRWMIPVSWLRQQVAGDIPSADPDPAPLDLDQLADCVADRVFARFARLFATLIPNAANTDSEAG
jgi:hypothetical protein